MEQEKRNETRMSGNSRHVPSHETYLSLGVHYCSHIEACRWVPQQKPHAHRPHKTFGRYKGHTITYQLKILPRNASEYLHCCILRYLLRRIWSWILIEHTTSNDFQNRTTYAIKHHIAKAADKWTCIHTDSCVFDLRTTIRWTGSPDPQRRHDDTQT